MLVWSCAGSVVVALIVGFTWGGWVTGGTANEMAEDAGNEARNALASVICVESFLDAADVRAQLSEFQAIDSSYRQRQFIEEGGWAVMPESEEASRRAADLCAKVLAEVDLESIAAGGDVEAEASQSGSTTVQ